MSASRFVPLLNRILIEKIAIAPKSTSGIILPETKSGLSTGVVIAVNKGYANAKGNMINPILKVNDAVILPEFGGSEVKMDGKSYFIYREDDVLGIV